jgi:hypothetical protein
MRGGEGPRRHAVGWQLLAQQQRPLFDTRVCGAGQWDWRGLRFNWQGLLADAELLNHRLVALGIILLQVIEQATTLADHHQKPAPRSVVLLVGLEVFREFRDTRTQDRDLDLRAASVVRVRLVLLDDIGFMLSG